MYSDVSDNRDLSSSVAYSSDDIVWCVASAKQTPQWENMFRFAPGYFWIICFTAGYIGSFVLYKLLKYDTGRYHSFHVVCMSVWQTVWGIPSYFDPKNSCVRACYCTMLFSGIVGSTYVMAFFIKFLTMPIYEKQVNSMDEIVSNSFELCGQNETLSFYNHHQDSVCILQLYIGLFNNN